MGHRPPQDDPVVFAIRGALYVYQCTYCGTFYATMTHEATGVQLRAARNALGWSIERLAKEASISVRTIIRYEDYDSVPPSRGGNLLAIIEVMEAAGIEFIGTPDDAPGIRIHAQPRRS
jgi:predicted transcriptional regulator